MNNIDDATVWTDQQRQQLQQVSPPTSDNNIDDNDETNFDVVDVWFSRGELLRKLRLMEREDELERQRQQQEGQQPERQGDDSYEILDYQLYLQNQREIYDDYKHVNYINVNLGHEFAVASNNTHDDNVTPLIIRQDRTVGKGGLIWDAGYILADTLIQCCHEYTLLQDKPQRILEVGAGTGISGLMLAKTFPQSHIHLTDLPQLQPLLETNIKQSQLVNVTAGVLEWGKAPSDSYQKYDIILGADVVAGIYDGDALLKTLYDMSHSRTQIFLSTRDRLNGIMDDVVKKLQERFDIVEKRLPTSSNKNPTVYLIYCTGKRRYQ